MGDQNGEPLVREVVDGTRADPLQPPAAPAQAPAVPAQAPAVPAQAPAAPVQAPAAPAQAPAVPAQAPEARLHALATLVHTLATQSQALATQTQALAAEALVAPNNDVNADEKRVVAYKEIANLHEINLFYPIHKLALEEWQRKEEYLSNSVSRREVRSAELTNQIYNIFGWFAVFQGVVLTAVSQLTQTQTAHPEPLCGKIWFPILLTGCATLATIGGILHKFGGLQSLELTIHTEREAKFEVAKRASGLRRKGPRNFKFHEDTDNSRLATPAKPFWKNRFWVIVALVIFTGIFILSYFVILCDTWVHREWDGGLHG